jgi:hypothetical protein
MCWKFTQLTHGAGKKRKKSVWLMETAFPQPVATVLSHLSEEVPYKPDAINKYTKFQVEMQEKTTKMRKCLDKPQKFFYICSQ